MKRLISFFRPAREFAGEVCRMLPRAAIALAAALVQWAASETHAQSLPLSLGQSAFLFNTNTYFGTNYSPGTNYAPGNIYAPGINWQSTRGVPVTTNANPATGSDGRLPTVQQQISFGTNFPTAPATTNQFRSFVSLSAVPVQKSTVINTSLNFSQNAETLNWPRGKDANGNVLVVLRSAQVGAPYLIKLNSFPFGSVIPVPLTDENGLTLPNGQNVSYWFSSPYSPPGSTNLPYYYSPNAKSVFATQPGQVSIVWEKTVPSSTVPTGLPASVGYVQQGANYYLLYTNTYLVSGEAVKPPQKIYWTEGDRYATGHAIDIPQVIQVNVIYSSSFPQFVAAPGDTAANTTPVYRTNTLWYDSSENQIRADNIEGRVFVELLGELQTDGTRRFLGFEIVDVFSEPIPIDVNVELGTRIMAYQDGRDDSQLLVSPLANTTQFYYRQSAPNSANYNLYATHETTNLNDFEAHWLISGIGGLRWPYLFDRYHEYWPSAPSEYVNYVRPLVATEAEAASTAVQLPAGEAPSIAYQDDPDHALAKLSADGLFYTFLNINRPSHRTLLQFISGNNIAYERVFSWLDVALKTNSIFAGTIATNLTGWDPTNLVFGFSDLSIVPYVTTNDVNVGDRITAPSGLLGSVGTNYVAGYIIQSNGNSFNPGAYFDPFVVGFNLADRGAIIPVNAIPGSNTLEVLWFRQDSVNTALGFQPSYWPVVLGHYNLHWPTNTTEIIMANNAGTGQLGSLRASGSIYGQPNPALPGYNPNEEHALILGGQAFALRDDLNNTNAVGYTSDPYVLINFIDSDGRPSMTAYHVRREAPELGVLFDYVVNAGTILQAPMPLPLLSAPVEGSGPSVTNYNTSPPGTSGDLPNGWTPSYFNSAYSNYAGFTYEDRKHNFWVYRGLNSGLPALRVGAYNQSNDTFGPLTAAVAISNQPFAYYIHVSRQNDALTMASTNLPYGLTVGLTTNGFAITGTPSVMGSNLYWITTQDTSDNTLTTNSIAISVVPSGTPVFQSQITVLSSNQYSAASVTYSNRPPFLAKSPTITNSFTMRFYYKNLASFDWPGVATPPAVGAVVPYLRPKNSSADPTSKHTPSLDIVYRPVWPSIVNNQPVPTLYSGQTLTVPINNLAAIRGQSSVLVLYQQSIATNNIASPNLYQSVTLFDPTVQKTSNLTSNNLTDLPASVNASAYQGREYFANLPPNLKNRVFYDPNTQNLVLQGQFMDEVVGDKYLFLNVLTGNDLLAVENLCSTNDASFNNWLAVVTNLSTPLYTFHEPTNAPGTYVADANQTVIKGVGDLVNITSSDQPVDSYALSATGPGLGYITYIVGNGKNPLHAGEPVSVYIAHVAAPLYAGSLKVINDPNPLSELITFQHTDDLGGRTANYQYDWRLSPPINDQPPTTDPLTWANVLTNGNDVPHFTLGGNSGILSLGDNYISVRFRETDAQASPANTNWSPWTSPVLAEGYIKRVLNGINPFNQRTTDLFNNAVNTTGNIITQAGHRWEGDVALNATTITNAGLIEIYETILHRGEALSINAGYNYGPANDALLLATGYLNDLYSLIASDALADAANPTIGIGTADKTYGSIATALFAFKGQEPSLLEEELALLRGRDDSLSPGVNLSPVYNRLYWNYTRGIDAGEVIYALNYNILDENNDGVVNAADAAILFPMGHGDAYGHYLTAIGNYYQLLINPNFDWVPRIETVNVLGAAVSVGYQDERKFAASAAALARTGLQVFDLTWRQGYTPGTSGGWNYFDTAVVNANRTYTNGGVVTNVTRFWGMDHWASRTAQGAYLNWVVDNAILPPIDPNPEHQGIQKVDRTTVPELAELPQTATQLQEDMNNAEAGFTPLNLSQNAVPFDINPLQVTGPNPMTHFEQVYQRAVVALNNAVVAFDDAQNVTQLMRSEEDSLADLQAGVTSQELSYNNQLIELYGTPYPDDMGPGKYYSQDYNGPDLAHYTYVETPDTNTYGGILPDPTKATTNYVDIQSLPNNWSTTMYSDFNFIYQTTASGYYTPSNNLSVAMVIGPDGFFSKPAGWTSQRSSPGQIQQAISTLVGSEHDLRQSVANASGDKQSLDKAMNAFTASVTAESLRVYYGNTNLALQTDINNLTANYNIAGKWIQEGEQVAADVATAFSTSIPANFIGGVAVGGDVASPARGAAYLLSIAAKWILLTADAGTFTTYENNMKDDQKLINDFSVQIANSTLDTDTKNAVLALGAQENSLQGDLVTINQKLRAFSDAQAAYSALVAQGNRIQAERLAYRQHAAALVQGFRTRDAAFRVFQNEKLERYKTLFDLAAKYAYMSAQAYDYETGLLGTTQGQTFLNRIISAQALGVVNNGLPQYAGSDTGDPGLSSAMAEMKADWDVLKGRLGFNNPDGYGTTVSLRSENYRILPGTNGDSAWQQILQQNRVADLRADADVMRNCLQIENGSGLAVPGIILTFSTTITDGYNLFGNPLAPGDHNFSPSSFATKIFSTGVCMDGYIGMDNPSASGGTTPADPTLDPNALAATPYVYLIPVGQDSMRSPPLGDTTTIRSWDVDDVAIPLPFNVSAANFSTTPFYNSANSLSEPLFGVRGHQAFRPVSTTSVFNTSIYGANGALQPSQYTNKRLIGRSIWNSKWKLVIPGRNLLSDPNQGLDRLIQSLKDVHFYFITYSYAGS